MALTAFRVSATERGSPPDRPKRGVDLGYVRHAKVPADARMAEHLSATGVEKLYDLILDCHRHGTRSLLRRSIAQPPRECLQAAHTGSISGLNIFDPPRGFYIPKNLGVAGKVL
jgi:hypothetical protein